MNDSFDYCHEVEAYLCKKNEGHLIRIVGPAFEMVRGWAEQGVPLKIALRGIDRTCDRHNAKPGRKRPLRIEFCEADVLDEFDAWRRAIGVTEQHGETRTEGAEVAEAPRSRKEPLAAHIERAVSRLLALRVKGADSGLAETIAATVEALDELVTNARGVRGEARAAVVGRLAELDAQLMDAARRHVNAAAADALRREVDAELAPFASRMTDEAKARASALAFERLLRESSGLPVLTYH